MTTSHPKGSAEFINRLNKIKVLNLIRESGKISRAGIVKETGLSAPTVTRIVDSLINNEKLVEHLGIGESSGGRPPLIVRFNGEESYVIGVDWGRTHIFGVLANLNGKSLTELDIMTDVSDDFQKDMNRVVDLIEKLLRKSGIDKKTLKGIGVAAAGFVNKRNHIIEYSPNFKWENADIKQPLIDHFQVPVMVDNVSRVMALGELLYGIGETCKDFIFINVGYGIGAGIISNGRPFFGFDGMAGEIGHNRVVGPVTGGRKCACGKMDCLECYSSGRGITEMGTQQRPFYPKSLLHSSTRLSTEIIAGFARQEDELALQLFHQAADFLGLAILDDEAAVIGAVSLILSDILNFRV